MYRTGSGQSRKSDGNIRAARDRHAATSRSDVSPNRSSGSPSCRTASSFAISPNSVSSPSRPGSAFTSANSPSEVSSTRNRAQPAAPSFPTISAANTASCRRSAELSTRSICPSVGGSIPSLRHRCRNAASNRPRSCSTGHCSVASHAVHRCSSSSVAGRNPNAARI